MQGFSVARRHHFVVAEGQRGQGCAHRREGLAHGLAFNTDQVVRMQAPAPPLANHPGGQVADRPDTTAREVTRDRGQHRGQAMPEQPGLVADLRAVLAPVAAAGGNGDDAGQALMAFDQWQDLRADTVADPVQRQLTGNLGRRGEHRAAVVARPVEDVHVQLAKRHSPRAAHAQVIEGHHLIAALGEPVGEVGVEALRHAHRRRDQHDAAWQAARLIPVAGQGMAVAVVDGAFFNLYRRHLVVLRASAIAAIGAVYEG